MALNREDMWALVRRTATTLEFGEEPTVDFEGFPVDELDGLRAILAPVGQAVRLLQSKTLTAMQPSLGARGFVKFGERVYRAAPDNSWKLREEHASEFWEWVTAEDAARRLFNPNQARISGLRELGDHWLNTETGEVGWAAFEDYFLTVTVGEVAVSEMPASRAPKFIQEWVDGEVEHRD